MKLFEFQADDLVKAALCCWGGLLLVGIGSQGAFSQEIDLTPPWLTAEGVIPPVLLAEQQQKLCAVKVGDKFPATALPKLDGKQTKFADLLGKQGTVVFLFNPGRRMSRTGFADLELDIAKQFGNQGINVVAIAVNSSAGDVRKLIAETNASYPVLLDSKAETFAKVGTEMLPRIYAVDRDGKIVWFDIEYSLATRRELRQVVLALVKD